MGIIICIPSVVKAKDTIGLTANFRLVMNQTQLLFGRRGALYLVVFIGYLFASGYSLLEPIVKTTRPTTARPATSSKEMSRKQVLAGGFCSAVLGLLCSSGGTANAMTIQPPSSSSGIMSSTTITSMTSPPSYLASYKSLSIPVEQFGVTVPVACWIPSKNNDASPTASLSSVSYDHRISVRRIGQLLAKWDFIPEFTSRDFTLSPTSPYVSTGADLPSSDDKGIPVVILAHGYLGSRYDLSHLAEQLANEGFLCLAPEYPESLAASYERMDGLDRAVINDRLLKAIANEWKLPVSKFGMVGHSAGCGTALKTGDASWTRVCISGIPLAVQRDGTPMPDNVLYVTSTNDFVMKRFATDPLPTESFDLITEDSLPSLLGNNKKIPTKAIYQLDRPDGPNHISFLAEGTNNAMIDLLSPLLPVAQALDIPVLDFDQYQKSKDSVATAKVYQPLVIQYLKQQMM